VESLQSRCDVIRKKIDEFRLKIADNDECIENHWINCLQVKKKEWEEYCSELKNNWNDKEIDLAQFK
jgi:hypothetical protein